MTRWRWRTVAISSALAAGLLAGCTPAGVDGNLTDDWKATGEIKPFTPAEKVCHAAGYKATGPAAEYETVDCTATHGTETIYVGTLAGEGSTGREPPEKDSDAYHAAYADCEREAKEFLGDDWRSGRIWLGITLPSEKAWGGGAHWFRCDLIEVKSKDDDTPVPRKASMKDALRDEGPLAYTCYDVTSKNNTVEEMKPRDCDRTHNAEFVGVYVPPDTEYQKLTQDRWDSYHSGCRTLIAKYVGVSASDAKEVGSVASPYSQEEWERGNRGVRCHLWLEDKTTRKSLKGAGAIPS